MFNFKSQHLVINLDQGPLLKCAPGHHSMFPSIIIKSYYLKSGVMQNQNLFLENWHFWNFRTSIFSKSVYFLILNNFFKNGSPGQTTMLMRRAAKFWVEPRSPFSEIFYQESKTIGKPPNIVSWPECQPEFPNDADGDDTAARRQFFYLTRPLAHSVQGSNIPFGNPSLRCMCICNDLTLLFFAFRSQYEIIWSQWN